MMREKLVNDFKLLEKQMFWLGISLVKCHGIGVKNEYSIDEFGYF